MCYQAQLGLSFKIHYGGKIHDPDIFQLKVKNWKKSQKAGGSRNLLNQKNYPSHSLLWSLFHVWTTHPLVMLQKARQFSDLSILLVLSRRRKIPVPCACCEGIFSQQLTRNLFALDWTSMTSFSSPFALPVWQY